MGTLRARGEEEDTLTPDMMSHPPSSKSLYFIHRLTSDWSPGEIPRTRKGNQTNRSLKSVLNPGK